MAPLAGLRVVERGGGPAGLVGRWLADLGAQVVRARGTDAPDAFPGVDAGKRVVDAVPDGWIRRAELVIDGGGPALATHASTVHLRMEPGLGLPASDGLVGAATGLYEVPLGLRPRFHRLPLASFLGAAHGAVGAMAALVARRRDGRGQAVDVRWTDAALSAHELLAAFTDRPPTAWNPLQWAGTPFIGPYRCAEGTIYVHLGLATHLARFLAWLGPRGAALRAAIGPQTARDPGAPGSVWEAARIRRALDVLFASRSATAWEAVLGGLGFCAVEVRTPEAWRDGLHARASGLVGQGPGPVIEAEGRSDAAFDPDAWPELAEPWGDDRRPPLAGFDVLDLTRVIAGPTAGRALAELGARVVRVDDPWFRPAWVDAFHAVFDRGKQGVWLDLGTPAGRRSLAELAGALRPSIVVENFRPGRGDALGLDELGAGVRVGLTAYGNRGPWGRWPGWEQTAQAACGVMSDCGGLFPSPVHDVATGLFGAFGALVGLYAGGGRVGASLAATSTWLQAARLFGGALPEDGWVRERGWVFREGGVEVGRVRPSAALSRSALARRARLEGVGELTLIGSPVRFSRSEAVDGDPRPRGADSEAWTGRAGSAPEGRSRSRVAFAVERVRWGLWAAASRR